MSKSNSNEFIRPFSELVSDLDLGTLEYHIPDSTLGYTPEFLIAEGCPPWLADLPPVLEARQRSGEEDRKFFASISNKRK